MSNLRTRFLFSLGLACVAGAYACAGAMSTARIHPQEVEGWPLCSTCHNEEYARFDHGADFGTAHRDAARQEQRICEGCHQVSFCADCHAEKEELEPADKRFGQPDVSSPHGGDYLTQHRFDGSLNPARCFGCHGRRNDWRCVECHR
jgi:hypothetical protein